MKKTACIPGAPQNIKKPFDPIEVLQRASALTRKLRNERIVRGQCNSLNESSVRALMKPRRLSQRLIGDVGRKAHGPRYVFERLAFCIDTEDERRGASDDHQYRTDTPA
jgi:DNA-binding response OmpR family regulator